MAGFLVGILIKGVAVFLVAELLPGIRVRNFPTALLVALIFGILHAVFAWLLVLLTLPFILLTLGLFYILINAFLLWVTSRIIDGFDIEGFVPLVAGTILISLVDMLIRYAVAA